MDSFKFTCPSCGQKLEGERDWIGEPTECPKCHNRFNIPDSDATPPEASVGGAPGYVPPSRSASTFETATDSNAQRQGGHTYSPPPPPQGFPPPQGGYAPPPQGFPPPQGGYAPPPQGGYAPPPWGLPQTFVPNNPKEPVSAASFSYQRVGNKFYVIGDYPTVFAVVNDFCSRSQLQVEKSDINLGCITIKFNYENTHFVFFYQEFDKMIIEVASNAIKFQSAIDRQLQRLFEIVEAGLYQYRTGQYMPNICYDAMLPQSYQRAEIDYTSVAKTWVWAGPLFTIFMPFGFLIALIFGLISLVKIYSTRAKKGQEFVYISFGLDIVGLIFNIILWVLLW